MKTKVVNANLDHINHAAKVCEMIEEAARKRGTGIAKRTIEYIQKKIIEGKAVIALQDEEVVGFCYIETWEHGMFVANSGLIVHERMRNSGLARQIKTKIYELSRNRFPEASLFGITTSLAVMKINHDLGYKPVTFSELTNDEEFWAGCEGCVNVDILKRTNRSHCLCTAMLLKN